MFEPGVIYDDAADLARALVGNWLQFDSYAHFGDEDPARDAVLHISHRDADSLTRSNYDVMTRDLEELDPDGEWHGYSGASHWAVGYVEGFTVALYDATGELTPVAHYLYDVYQRLQNYPLLDEMHHSDLEYGEFIEFITSELMGYPYHLPALFVDDVIRNYMDWGTGETYIDGIRMADFEDAILACGYGGDL